MNFSRFNDAVIQCSLLRAVLPGEADYALDQVLSRAMANNIITCLRSNAEPDSDASFEYLLALALQRVSLTRDDLAAALNSHKYSDRDLGWFLAEYIRDAHHL